MLRAATGQCVVCALFQQGVRRPSGRKAQTPPPRWWGGVVAYGNRNRKCRAVGVRYERMGIVAGRVGEGKGSAIRLRIEKNQATGKEK